MGIGLALESNVGEWSAKFMHLYERTPDFSISLQLSICSRSALNKKENVEVGGLFGDQRKM